ncbi:Phosphatidylglycerol/phosphatidylinositol transfer protein [Elasticomyces elasticus]|nr:Phosphatidylglycerol/phosphatidylinositol transfer protein [Elasticomyces elasticus]
MRITTALTSVLLASATTARLTGSWLSGNEVSVFDDAQKVPGENPLTYCKSVDLEKAILKIDHVNLSPNPPEAGKALNISAKGTLSEDIEDGAKVHLQVKYGLIRIINQEADLCEQVGQVDLKCPLKKGEMVLTTSVELPNEIPPGKYTVLADVITKEKDTITCLEATVAFHR